MSVLKAAVRGVVLVALATVVGVLIGVAGGSLHWLLDLAGQFLLPAIVVAVGSAIVAAVLGWRWTAGAAAVIAVVAYATAMPFTSAPAAVAPQATRFTVLLFNVWYRNGMLADVREMAERTNADMVVFVETTQRVSDELQPLASHYPYRLDCTGTGRCDILIFSRARLTPREVKETSDPGESPLLIAETEIAGCRMTLFATHLTRPFPKRPFWVQRAQAEEIADDIAGVAGAKLVLGDFNAAPWGHVMQTIAERGGVTLLTGGGGTWPSILPPQLRIPIDHMLAGPGLSFVSRQVLGKLGSDHLPVLAEIAVTDRSKCR